MKSKKKSGQAAKKLTVNKVTAKPRLTGLQKRSVDIFHCMKKPSKLKAYQMAGSKMKGKVGCDEARKMFEKPHVAAYHESLKQKATENASKTEAEIIAEMEKLAFKAENDKVKIRALELLGRRFGLFPTNIKVKVAFDWRSLIKDGTGHADKG